MGRDLGRLPSKHAVVTTSALGGPGTANASDFIPFGTEDLEHSVPDRFEKVVRRVADRTAVKIGEHVVTYQQLNDLADRIARALLARHDGGPEPVGLLFNRGVSLTAAMLGVLKAGKFFVPLDGAFPMARIAMTLEDSGAAIVITDRQNRHIAEALRGDSRVVVDVESIDAGDGQDPCLPISSSSLACIIYTSGSTGVPKGVVLHHAALLHNAMLQAIVAAAGVRDRVSLLTSGTANAISTTFFTLLSGAALFPFDVGKEGLTRLAEWLSAEKISVGAIASPLFRRFCASLRGDEAFPDLRVLRLTSENVYSSDVDLYKKHFPVGCTLVNGLASTEAGPMVANRFTHDDTIAGNDVPVGYPLPGKEILLLDDIGNRVGVDEMGEIAVRSRYLARGYWRRSEATQSRFRPEPTNDAESLYLTGDLGLMLSDGRLVHKGRKDFRVKIRGYGVDVVEVQRTLVAHPAVTDGVVVPSKNELGESRLVAFFASGVQPAPSIGELRAFLKERLPTYMIPAQFVMLDALPLSPNGKIDRSALTIPPVSPHPTASRAPATTAVEAKLVEIVGTILRLDGIGIHDDFFDLGGDSLAAAALVSAISAEFDVDIPIGALVTSPTIALLARQIQTEQLKRPAAEARCLVQLQAGSRQKPIVFFLPGGIGGDSEFFVYARLARHVGSEYTVWGLKSQSSDGTESSQATVEEMASDYIRAIRTLQPAGPYYLVGECAGGIVAFEMAQQLQVRGEAIALLLLMDTPRPDFVLQMRRRVNRVLRRIRENPYIGGSRFLWAQLQQRTLRDLLGYLIARRRRIADRAVQSHRLRARRATSRATEYVQRSYSRAIYAYRPKPYAGRMTLLIHDELGNAVEDPTLGWKAFILGGIDCHRVPGDHMAYIREHVQSAAKQIRECIERVARELD